MNVVYCVTANYIEKIKPSVKSLREHNPDVRIFLVTETDEADIEDVEVIDIRGQEWFTPNNCVNYGNPYTYIGLLKVCYQTLLPVDKVIHMDADTIIADSLEDMWNIDLTDKWYAMCDEIHGAYHPFGEHYWNAGIMVINLKELRQDGIQDLMVEYLCTVPQPWCEQDAFNKYGITFDKIVEMPVRFNENCMTGVTNHPAVVHYCAEKDWWGNTTMYRWEYLAKYSPH